MIKDYGQPYQNLYDTLMHSARKYPDKVAVIDDKEEVTYRELLKRVDEFAFILQNKYRLKEQEQIGFLMLNSAKMVTAFYATMKIGCIAFMINTKFREEEIFNLLKTMDVRLIISDTRWLDKIENTAKSLGIQWVLTEVADTDLQGKYTRINSVQKIDNTAVIMHTSGTTGMPKGVMVSHRNILEAAYGYQDVQKLDASDISVVSVPLFHILGLSCVTTLFMYIGATVVLSEFYNVENVLMKIKKYRATHFHSVPTIFLQMIESPNPEKDLTSLKTAVCGGAPIQQEQVDAFCRIAPNATVHLAYGMTETAGSGTLSKVHKGALMAVPNVVVKVVDKDHREVPSDVIGELVFCGPCVARERWGADALPDDHMYTGDVGYMDGEGHVYVIDRLKDIINRGGEKIFPIQIENVILQYPGIAEAAVYAIGSRKYGEVPAASVVAHEGVEIDVNKLHDFLKERVAKYKLPVFIELTDQLPTTQNGKVRKALLRKIAEERGEAV